MAGLESAERHVKIRSDEMPIFACFQSWFLSVCVHSNPLQDAARESILLLQLQYPTQTRTIVESPAQIPHVCWAHHLGHLAWPHAMPQKVYSLANTSNLCKRVNNCKLGKLTLTIVE